MKFKYIFMFFYTNSAQGLISSPAATIAQWSIITVTSYNFISLKQGYYIDLLSYQLQLQW